MVRKLVATLALLLALTGLAYAAAGGVRAKDPSTTVKLPQLSTSTTSPTVSPTTAATLTTTTIAVNDGLVQDPAVPSFDTATYGKRTFQGIPTLARVGKRLWAAWVGDASPTAWEATGNFLVLSYSDNNGQSWSREFYLVPKNPSTDRAFEPRLWAAPDGKLWVIYCQSGGGMVLDGQLGAWATVISNPLAVTPSFEPGFWMADGDPYRPFVFNGGWYIPIDYLGGNPTRFRERLGRHVYAFDWQNRSVTKVATIPPTPNADFNEPALVALKDGSVLDLNRSRDGLYQTRSAPGTLTFPTPTPWTFYPSIASRPALSRSPSGRLVAVWNETMTGAGRKDLTIALSNDEGASWPTAYIFDARDQVSYPDVDYLANGDILVVYDRGRNGYKEIWLAIIDEATLTRGRPKVTLRLVNKAL